MIHTIDIPGVPGDEKSSGDSLRWSAMQQQIVDTLTTAMPDAQVHLESPDGVHYTAVVVSAEFENLSLVKQHQRVMNALKSEFDSERLHALQLKTMTPDKWAAAQGNQ